MAYWQQGSWCTLDCLLWSVSWLKETFFTSETSFHMLIQVPRKTFRSCWAALYVSNFVEAKTPEEIEDDLKSGKLLQGN